MKSNSYVSLNNIMDLLLDAICVVDTRGRFVFVSAASKRIFGYSPEEMIGRPMIDFVFHEDRARTLQAAGEVAAGHPLPHFENRYVRKDGQIVHVMWSARWSEADQVRVGVARDVTERKRADAMQAALYAISDAAHWAEDLVALFQQTHQIIGGLLPAASFFVALYDVKKDDLSFPYHVDENDRVPAPQKPDSAALTASVSRHRRGFIGLAGGADQRKKGCHRRPCGAEPWRRGAIHPKGRRTAAIRFHPDCTRDRTQTDGKLAAAHRATRPADRSAQPRTVP